MFVYSIDRSLRGRNCAGVIYRSVFRDHDKTKYIIQSEPDTCTNSDISVHHEKACKGYHLVSEISSVDTPADSTAGSVYGATYYIVKCDLYVICAK